MREGQLIFVDMAGSETAAATGHTSGPRALEASLINKDVLAMGHIMRLLAEGGQGNLPFRDSNLTQLLKPSLVERGANDSPVSFICCISAEAAHATATKSTLQFASNAGKVELRPVVNEARAKEGQAAVIIRKLEAQLALEAAESKARQDEALADKAQYEQQLAAEKERSLATATELAATKQWVHTLEQQQSPAGSRSVVRTPSRRATIGVTIVGVTTALRSFHYDAQLSPLPEAPSASELQLLQLASLRAEAQKQGERSASAEQAALAANAALETQYNVAGAEGAQLRARLRDAEAQARCAAHEPAALRAASAAADPAAAAAPVMHFAFTDVREPAPSGDSDVDASDKENAAKGKAKVGMADDCSSGRGGAAVAVVRNMRPRNVIMLRSIAKSSNSSDREKEATMEGLQPAPPRRRKAKTHHETAKNTRWRWRDAAIAELRRSRSLAEVKAAAVRKVMQRLRTAEKSAVHLLAHAEHCTALRQHLLRLRSQITAAA